MWRVLLVEDQEIVRQGLKVILEQDEKITVTHEAANGAEALELVNENPFDLIMMDVRMPKMNGIEATRIIRKKFPKIKVLILTTFNDDEYAFQALKEGASAFLLKTANPNKLIEAVHSAMRGGLTLHDEVAAKVMPRLLQKDKIAEKPVPSIGLTDRETLITKLVGEGKTNKEIASELYLSVGTVKNHITNILQKIGLRDRTQLAIYAVKHDLT
ncbi:response regulator [Oceanobacillus sp. FSL H7-0719]|uniref:response regulator transcription factor n=1 Tax=Oceanobacillus sp. FSL H7-0719 TaxID=2954507 RepID=UPI003245F37E